MRAWWWVLVTANLVWGNAEQLRDVYSNPIDFETNPESVSEDKPYPSFILDPYTINTRVQRSAEGEEREKKQRRFHSWGGKRYGEEEEEEEFGDKSEVEKPTDDDSLKLVYFFKSLNSSDPKTYDPSKNLRDEFLKRIESSPVFFKKEEKRDPEILDDLIKRSSFYGPAPLQNSLNSRLEQSTKRYPSFSSWAGKRASSFSSWGGKRNYFREPSDLNDDTGQQLNSNDNIHDFDNSHTSSQDPDIGFDHTQIPIYNGDNEILRTYLEEKSGNSPEEESLLPEVKHHLLKRTAAFNSWGGKRFAQGNRWITKKPLAFNSWAGKRTTAFNSWGGKRAAAFNSWGGKREAAFNSWGGKRGAAFNSWGGKRAAAFNSWGGKRAAAFNSWGGKRAAAFNSWGGKRDVKWNETPKLQFIAGVLNKDYHGTHFSAPSAHDLICGTQLNDLMNQIDKYNLDKQYKIPESLGTVGPGGINSLEKRDSSTFSGNTDKRNPLFSSWLGNKIPTVLLTNGKRRPAFSSWGGKRSKLVFPPPECSSEKTEHADINAHKTEEVYPEEPDKTLQSEESNETKKKREAECKNVDKDSLTMTERGKRSSGNSIKHKVFTRMMLQGGWPTAFKSMTHGKDFFAWGGKRSIHL